MVRKLIEKLAKKNGISIAESSKVWDSATKIATSKGQGNNVVYTNGVYKKFMGEKLTFKEFLMLAEEGESSPPTNTSGGTMPDHKATDGKPKKKKIHKRTKVEVNEKK